MSEQANSSSPIAPEPVMPSGKPTYLNIPEFHVSSFTTFGREDALTILCANPAVAADENGAIAIAQKPRVALHIPPVEAKELIVLLQAFVSMVESERGELTSEFLKGQRAS